MLDECEGCNYHQFPYKAHPPISGCKEKVFNDEDDVLEIFDELVKEVKLRNEEGHNFDIASSVSKQLPFFCCPNVFISKEMRRDLQRYLYCKDANISAYPGDYSKQPALWVDKHFIFKSAISKKQDMEIEKRKREAKLGSK